MNRIEDSAVGLRTLVSQVRTQRHSRIACYIVFPQEEFSRWNFPRWNFLRRNLPVTVYIMDWQFKSDNGRKTSISLYNVSAVQICQWIQLQLNSCLKRISKHFPQQWISISYFEYNHQVPEEQNVLPIKYREELYQNFDR